MTVNQKENDLTVVQGWLLFVEIWDVLIDIFTHKGGFLEILRTRTVEYLFLKRDFFYFPLC